MIEVVSIKVQDKSTGAVIVPRFKTSIMVNNTHALKLLKIDLEELYNNSEVLLGYTDKNEKEEK